MSRARSAALAAAALLPACTAVKPVVCTFTYPIDVMSENLSVPDDPSDDYEDIPPPLLCAAAPVLLPLRFVGLALMGFAGGLVSGFASDLNMILWSAETPWKNMTRPFLTNRKSPDVE
jgi:hypothetical protein